MGYSLAFNGDGAFIGNFSKFMFNGVTEGSVSGDIPESLFALFQMTFAVITPALIIGAFAERIKFSAVLIFSTIWLAFVYAPVTHWVWGGGWLQQMGLLDFAGGTVVHITAGVAALVTAIMIGPRKSFVRGNAAPHNMTMTITGAGMLWVGWFGFNGGSALAANGDAAMPRWAPDYPLEAARWIESIPYNETRNYVQAVMSYMVIYEYKLNGPGQPVTRLSERLAPIKP